MSSEVNQVFSDAVDKMIEVCKKNVDCKEILAGKLAYKKQKESIESLNTVIDYIKNLMDVDETDIDIKNYREMQTAISNGEYKKVKEQYWQMDTSPREYIPDSVDEWLIICKNIESCL